MKRSPDASPLEKVSEASAALRNMSETPVPFPQPRQQISKQPCGECHLQRGETCDICGARERDDFADIVVEGSAVIRACAEAYGEPVPYFAAHDACKRFYRMGWRKVAPPEVACCSRCGAENVVTAQSVCIDCVGKPALSRTEPT